MEGARTGNGMREAKDDDRELPGREDGLRIFNERSAEKLRKDGIGQERRGMEGGMDFSDFGTLIYFPYSTTVSG